MINPTEIIKINNIKNEKQNIKKAAEIIKSGGLVAFPTETVYGLGANALDEEAVLKIFKAKGRPSDNPLIVHIADTEQINELVKEIPEKAKVLMEKFWPGPLTLLFEKSDKVPLKTSGGLNTVAIRMPNNEISLELIRQSNLPIAAPSANTSGRPSPTSATHVIEDLEGKIDMLIDGGNTGVGLESTVLDISTEIPTILRPGAITIEDLQSIFSKVEYDKALETEDKSLVPKSPGQKYRHYSPKAEMKIFTGDLESVYKTIDKLSNNYTEKGLKVGIMSTDESKTKYSNGTVISMGSRKNLKNIATNLFNILRQFDKLGVDIILAEGVEEEGIGKAIMNRMKKAAGGNIEEIIGGCFVKVLFVCTGNTCRSCMAEGLFLDMLKKINKDNEIVVQSAGIYATPNQTASENALIAMKNQSIDLNYHKSRQLTIDMLEESDLILTMTYGHKQSILESVPEVSGKVYTLKEYVGLNGDIQDPYGGSLVVYEESLNDIKESLELLIEKLA